MITVEDLYNAMIHTTQKFLNINNALNNYGNSDTFFKKKEVQSLK